MAYSDEHREFQRNERMREDVGPPNPYSPEQSAPSGRSVAIMLGVVIAIFLLIALFSWTSGGPEATTTGQSPAVEQSAPAPEPAAPAQ